MNKTQTLLGCIEEAEKNKVALGHFNFSNLEGLWAIVEAAGDLQVPVLVGLSEGERKFVGVRQARALVDSFKKDFPGPIFLSADHTYTLDGVKEVVDAGYDAVVVDGSKLSLAENIALTKEAVEYARANNPDMVTEGEVGYIGTSSKVLEAVPDDVKAGAGSVTPAIAKQFVEETGVDFLSPAVGNLHGMLKNMANPKLDIEKIRAIREEAGVPLVLHGGSGITDEEFKKAIEAGIGLIHVNTELRVAYKLALDKSLADNPTEVAPYRILKPAREAMKDIVLAKLKLFSGK